MTEMKMDDYVCMYALKRGVTNSFPEAGKIVSRTILIIIKKKTSLDDEWVKAYQ